MRLFLIFALIFYVLYKFGFFRAFSSGLHENPNRRPPNSNVDIDAAPPREKKRPPFKGGEYVDYEEIK